MQYYSIEFGFLSLNWKVFLFFLLVELDPKDSSKSKELWKFKQIQLWYWQLCYSFTGSDVKVISKKQARNSFGFFDCGFCFAVSFFSAKSYNNIDFHSSDTYKLWNIFLKESLRKQTYMAYTSVTNRLHNFRAAPYMELFLNFLAICPIFAT